MSTQHAIVPPGEAAAPAAATSRARTTIVAAILVLGAVAVATVLLWHPGPPRDDFSYASMAPVRNATWFVALLDAIGYVAVTVALAVAACLLAPARGARWANTGAVFTALGGIAFGVGDFAYGVLGWYATSNALSADAGSRLMAYAKDNAGHLVAPQVAGFFALNLGVLLLAVALWRARSVPRWLPITLAVLTVAQFAGLPNRVLDVEQTLLMATFVTIAWFARRAATRRPH